MMRWVVLLAVLAACPSSRTSRLTIPTKPVVQGRLSWKKVQTAADLPPPPAPGTFQIHMIDVGTGLAVLIRGADFAMLYDAGTNDKEEKPSRVVDYLAAALGPSGDELCVSSKQRRKIDHVVLSHPHFDHASALDLVLHCYDVPDFWDAGRVNEAKFYRDLLDGIARSHARYHTAADVPEDHRIHGKGYEVDMPQWERFSEGDTVQLGQGARFTILHADAKTSGDMNQSSIVLLVDLGGVKLLLVGDAESGARKDPSYPVGEVEEFLIDAHTAQIHADILQVGHHGSKTSSRRAFLQMVKPAVALVSAGPHHYRSVVLPDREVIDELHRIGAKVLRTDERDADCPVHGRIGGDEGPGGCDNWVITIDKARDAPPVSR